MMGNSINYKKWLMTVLTTMICFAIIYPFIWMVSSSLKPLGELYQFPPKLISGNMSLNNYKEVLFNQAPSFLTYLFNSIFVTVVSLVGTLITSSFAGYAFAKMDFKYRDQLFLLYLATTFSLQI